MFFILSVVVVQIALIAVVAGALQYLLRGRSATTRHGICTLALIAIAMTGPSKLLVPPVAVVVQPTDRISDATELKLTQSPDSLPENDIAELSPELVASITNSSVYQQPVYQPPALHDELSQDLPATKNDSWLATLQSLTLVPILVGLYFVGFSLLILRLIYSAVRLHSFSRHGFSLPAQLLAETERIASSLSLRHIPVIRVCQQVTTPMVYGMRRSAILLPESFCDLSVECQRSVLTHEMAHIARHDGRWELFSQLVRCVYWFHPAVHMVTRVHRVQRELATDEAVIRAGVNPIAYAGHLLDVLNRNCRMPSLAIAMSHFGDFESRLQRILTANKGTDRSRAPLVISAGLFVAIAMCSVELVAQNLETQPIDAKEPLDSSNDQKNHVNPPIEKAVDVDPKAVFAPPAVSKRLVAQKQRVAPRALLDAKPKTLFAVITNCKLAEKIRHPTRTYSLSGRVTDRRGNPVAGAAVAIRMSDTSTFSVNGAATGSHNLLARSRTDAEGFYRFHAIPAVADPLLNYENWSVVVATQSEDYGWAILKFDRKKNTLTGKGDITVSPPTMISGFWVTPDGGPIEGTARIISYHKPGYFDGRSFDSTKIHVPIRATPNEIVSLDPNGRFQFANVPQGSFVSIELRHKDWPVSFARIATSDDVQVEKGYESMLPKYWFPPATQSGVKHVAEKGIQMKGIVVNEKNLPIPRCLIQANTPFRIVTDKEGRFSDQVLEERFRFFGNAEPQLSISVSPRDNAYLYQRTTISRSELLSSEPLRIVLERSIPIVGKVQTSEGKPVADAIVRAHPHQSSNGASVIRRAARTKADGSFQIGVGHGRYSLKVSMPEASNTEPIQIADVEASMQEYDRTQQPIDLATFKIPRGEEVSIRCVDRNGAPVSAVNVSLYHKVPHSSRYPQVAVGGTTDKDGRFTFRPTVVYASNLVVHADLETTTQHLWGEVTLPANPIDKTTTVVMKQKWRVFGKTTVNGEPMKDVSVMVWRNGPGISHRGSHSMSGEGRFVNDDGTYEWFVPPGGSYYVNLWGLKSDPHRGSGRMYQVRQFARGQFQAEEIKFVYAEGTISGRVTTRKGGPISGISVNANMSNGTRQLLAHPSKDAGKTQTKKDGTFTIEGLPEGDYRLSAYSRSRPKSHLGTSVNAKSGQNDVRIIMVPASLSSSKR